jgi:uncharacterized protein (DUF983 family)
MPKRIVVAPKCANCGKRAVFHRASDNACPIGIKYRAGYTAFSLQSKFKDRR